jgi:hypothetical protein
LGLEPSLSPNWNRQNPEGAPESHIETEIDSKPASTLIVGGLANPAWKIEVEGIAVA